MLMELVSVSRVDYDTAPQFFPLLLDFLEVAAMEALGRTRWAIAEGYIPSSSDRAVVSHETACILNATDRDAHVAITIFFADCDPVGPYRLTVAARRTLQSSLNTSTIRARFRAIYDYASVFESDVPIVVQHT